MKIAVRYHSLTGHTKKIANAIAGVCEVNAMSIKEPLEKTDVLFLGGAIYAGQMSPPLREFVSKLDSRVKRVAIFCSSTSGDSIAEELRIVLREKGIAVFNEDFHCLGSFLFTQRGRPNIDDIELAKEYAKRILAEVKLEARQ